MSKTTESYDRFDEVLRRLRKECPWDRKQTWQSLRTQTIEEVYELAQAIEDKQDKEVEKELGDVLLHVAFYALIAEEESKFDLSDVLETLCNKLIFRHPHVFGEDKAKDADEVLDKWEKIKLKEKDGNKGVLSGVARALPALIKAYRIQGKVKGVGFDWKDAQGALDKVNEELEEFKDEAAKGDCDKMEAEMGDLLFSVVNLARHYGINPENALERTNRKFISRFGAIEDKARQMGKQVSDLTLMEMDAIWEEAKKRENAELARLAWDKCRKEVETKISPEEFKTWFEPIEAISLKGNLLEVKVPSAFFMETIEDKYLKYVLPALRTAIGEKARLAYVVEIL